MICVSRRWRGYSVVLGGVLIHLTLGTIYTFGNMTPYMTSYMKKHKVDETLNYAESTWIMSLAAMGQGASMFLGGMLYKALGPKLSTLIGGWLASAGVALTYFTIKSSFYWTLFTYGFMFGIGVGLAYATPMGCAMKWLPHKEGLVNGCVVAGFGGGAFIFDQIQTAFINPNNQKADLNEDGEKYFTQDNILDRVPHSFLLLGGCYAAMQFIGSMLLQEPPEQYSPLINCKEARRTKNGGKNKGANMLDEESDSDKENENPNGEERNFSPRETLRQSEFYKLWFIYLFNGQGISFISSLYKAFGQTFISDDYFLAVVGSLSAVCNGGGRIMWGALADKYSFKTAMVFSTGLFSFFILSFELTSLVGKPLYLIWVCCLFLSFSGNFSLLPTATARAFGKEHYGVNYGMVFTASVISSPIAALLTSKLKVVIHWYGMFYMVAFFSFLSMCLAWSFKVKDSTGKDI
ncbi:oxalate:formate antiporter-like [Saccostrea cucullata]|uniref:oxalate:formate antiporter-like n=1 Tax=Saccostrea cuccullata TaxID=36930 RepID=UPI002ED3081F